MLKAVTEIIKCSFCGKKREKVELMVGGSAAYICNECVDECMKLMGKGYLLTSNGEEVDFILDTFLAKDDLLSILRKYDYGKPMSEEDEKKIIDDAVERIREDNIIKHLGEALDMAMVRHVDAAAADHGFDYKDARLTEEAVKIIFPERAATKSSSSEDSKQPIIRLSDEPLPG